MAHIQRLKYSTENFVKFFRTLKKATFNSFEALWLKSARFELNLNKKLFEKAFKMSRLQLILIHCAFVNFFTCKESTIYKKEKRVCQQNMFFTQFL